MHHSNNIEPRRMWNHTPQYRDWNRDWEDALDEDACVACGAMTNLVYTPGAPFCRECLDHAKGSHLSEDYDDLGVGD